MKDLLEKVSKKTLILVGGFFILIFIVIFGGALLYNKLFYKFSYSEVENIMKEAAISYLDDNSEKLPLNINDSITIPEDSLVNANKMKSIKDLLKNGNDSCNGEVIVTNINNTYRYNPILSCENEYESIKFIDYIKDNISIVESGNGLHKINEELVYRGDNVDNYLTLSGKNYRIVKFRDDYTVLILTEKLENTTWDDRYNIEKDGNLGINNYNVSRIKDYLTSLYEGNSLINDNDKLLLASHNIEIGKRATSDTDKSGNLEKASLVERQFISLLPAYDFLNASLDSNCTTTTAVSCTNYNYLAKYKLSWWLATANAKNTHHIYKIDNSIGLANASSNAYVRPVIYLTKDAIYVSGDGSNENPYVVR